MLQKEVQAYLSQLQRAISDARRSGSATPELSFRPILHKFFEECCRRLKPDEPVHVVFEPNNTGKGRPDFRFHDSRTFGVYGYVECKALAEAELHWQSYAEQLERYRSLGYPILFTDGLEFLLFEPDKPDLRPARSVCLVSSKKEFLAGQSTEPSSPEALKALLTVFLQVKLPDKVSLGRLTDLLAARARFLRDDVRTLLRGTGSLEVEDEHVAEQLRRVFELFREQLDRALTEEKFASVAAQILVFALLIAWRDSNRKVDQGRVATLLTDYPPLQALCEVVESHKAQLGILRVGWEDTKLLLSYVCLKDPTELADYHRVYEEFHSKFSPEERIDFGAYATPAPLAEYMISLCDDLLSDERFGVAGLFDPTVRIVDPGCGTGIFLEKLTTRYAETSQPYGDLGNTFGIELLPVPYALAQMRLAAVAKERGLSVVPAVFMGNSLSNPVVRSDTAETAISGDEPPFVWLLKREYNNVIKSTRPPVMVVIGNPPASDKGLNTGEEFTEINKALDVFRPPKKSDKGTMEQQATRRRNITKGLQNDAVKFLRWASLKIHRHRGGIISFVLPHSLIDHPTYQYLRKFFLENYDEIYVLELDTDKRLFDTNAAKESVFPTQQGRAVLTFVQFPRNPRETGLRKPAKLYYASITGLEKRADKIHWLKTEVGAHLAGRSLLEKYVSFEPVGDRLAFRPICDRHLRLYKSFPSIDSLFERWISGVKTGCTSLVVHSEIEGLRRLLQDYIREDLDDATLYKTYFEGQQKPGNRFPEYTRGWRRAWMAKHIIRDGGVKDARIYPYDFRPFVRRYIYYLPEMFKENSGGRPRPDLKRSFCDHKGIRNVALAVAQSPHQLGVDLDEFTSFVTALSDNDLVARGDAYIFPAWFADPQGPKLVRNIKPHVVKALARMLGYEQDIGDERYSDIAFYLVCYLYGVTVSDYYRRLFADLIYYGVMEGFARVPLTRNKGLFMAVVNIARKLAEVQVGERPPEAEYVLPLDVREEDLCNLPLSVRSVTIEPEQEKVLLHGDDGRQIEVKGIPQDVLEHRVSGYDVVAEWLKYKTRPYLRRNFETADLNEFAVLISAVNMHLRLKPELDRLVKDIIHGELLTFSGEDAD